MRTGAHSSDPAHRPSPHSATFLIATSRSSKQQRLLQDPLLTEPAGEEDAELVAELARERTAEEMAAALIRLYRANLPAVEEVSDPGYRNEARPPRGERQERGERSSAPRGHGEGIWFRLDIGRANNADPRRLLPMLCRRGDIGRQDIGAIRIFDRETKVEIHPDRADHFAEAVRRSGGVGAVGIERLDEGRSTGGKRHGRQERHDGENAPEQRKPRKTHKARAAAAR